MTEMNKKIKSTTAAKTVTSHNQHTGHENDKDCGNNSNDEEHSWTVRKLPLLVDASKCSTWTREKPADERRSKTFFGQKYVKWIIYFWLPPLNTFLYAFCCCRKRYCCVLLFSCCVVSTVVFKRGIVLFFHLRPIIGIWNLIIIHMPCHPYDCCISFD